MDFPTSLKSPPSAKNSLICKSRRRVTYKIIQANTALKFVNLATIKRKRGRPRRVELTGDFDINLIREFEKRPELYDRNSPNHKDKAYLDELWEELSQNLGYDSNIVKDRMLQLRNRYHIEKKRIENLQAESPRRPVESKWPLYEEMSFLSDHIPVRRSFRNMTCKRPYGSEFATVKNEHPTDAESEVDREEGGSEYIPGSRKGSIQVRSYGNLISKPDRNMPTTKPPQPQPNPQAPPRLTRMPRQVLPSRNTQAAYQRSARPQTPTQQPPNRLPLPYGSEKFVAFGRFLTSSLIELPENEALLLVNQFTSELVHSYLKKPDQTLSCDNDEGADIIQSNGHDDELQEV